MSGLPLEKCRRVEVNVHKHVLIKWFAKHWQFFWVLCFTMVNQNIFFSSLGVDLTV